MARGSSHSVKYCCCHELLSDLIDVCLDICVLVCEWCQIKLVKEMKCKPAMCKLMYRFLKKKKKKSVHKVL